MPLNKKKTEKMLRKAKTQRLTRQWLDSKKPKKKTGIKLAKATKRSIKSFPKPKPKKKQTIWESAKQLIVDPIKRNIKRGYGNILKNPFKSTFSDSKKDTKKI